MAGEQILHQALVFGGVEAVMGRAERAGRLGRTSMNIQCEHQELTTRVRPGGPHEDHQGGGPHEDHQGGGPHEHHQGGGLHEDHQGGGPHEDHQGGGLHEDLIRYDKIR